MVSWKSPFIMIFCQITFWIMGGRITFSCCWFRVGAGREALVPQVTIWFFSWQCPVSTCRRSTGSRSCFCKREMLMNERLLYRPPAYLNLFYRQHISKMTNIGGAYIARFLHLCTFSVRARSAVVKTNFLIKPVLRIRDVHPGSWFLFITDPGSNNGTIFCRLKYQKIKKNFSFWTDKKIFLAKKLRIIVLFTQNFFIKLSKMLVWDPGSRVKKAPDPDIESSIACAPLVL